MIHEWFQYLSCFFSASIYLRWEEVGDAFRNFRIFFTVIVTVQKPLLLFSSILSADLQLDIFFVFLTPPMYYDFTFFFNFILCFIGLSALYAEITLLYMTLFLSLHIYCVVISDICYWHILHMHGYNRNARNLNQLQI